MQFYGRVLAQLLERGSLSRDDSILVTCGGHYDAEVLREAGFRQVTISNLDHEMNRALEPYAWAREDAEQLSFADASFDWAIVNAGLHHCASPHRGLLELCRVARKGVLVIEARDSALMRLAVALRMTAGYETDAVVVAGYAGGGVRNSAIPNFIYRWTEREVIKTIESAYPHRQNDIRFFYGLRIPHHRLAANSLPKRAAALLLAGLAQVFQRVFRRQCNEFAFAILQSGRLKPWITHDAHGLGLRRDLTFGFDAGKYPRG